MVGDAFDSWHCLSPLPLSPTPPPPSISLPAPTIYEWYCHPLMEGADGSKIQRSAVWKDIMEVPTIHGWQDPPME